jgi:glycosyltransferase involved in cell wall biosynthesis
MSSPKVSVSLITYKQEKFIAECLDSILKQKVNFDFEIVVADDCSPDRTGEIVQEYASRYPNIVKAIRRPANLGMVKNAISTINECRGQYIALMEGDDLWINDDKLQIQTDFLDSNPDCVLCFTNQYEFNDGHRDNGKIHYNDTNKPPSKFDLDYFFQNNPLIPNNSKMFRREVQPAVVPDWFYTSLQWDWVLHVLQTKAGKFAYLDYITLGYRRHPDAIVIETNHTGLALSGLKTLKYLNGYLNYKYDYFCSRTDWHYNLLAFSYLERKEYLRFVYYYGTYLMKKISVLLASESRTDKYLKELTIKNDLWKFKQIVSGKKIEIL